MAEMTDAAPQGGDAASAPVVSVPLPVGKSGVPLGAREGASILSEWREKQRNPPAPVEPEAPVEQATESEASDEATDAVPPEKEATGETQETDPAAKPLLEPPRSWSREARERWNKLDPEDQKYLLDQDSKASTEVRRVQNEAAELRKATEAERKQIQETLSRYAKPETEAQILLDRAIKANGDQLNWEQLAATNKDQYVETRAAYDGAVSRLTKLEAEAKKARESEETDSKSKAADYRRTEFAKLNDLIPELKEEKTGQPVWKSMQDAAMKHGITGDELSQAADHRFWLLAHDAAKWQAAQKAAEKAKTAPVPPVQRPGVGTNRGNVNTEKVQALKDKFEQSGSIRDGAALMAARRGVRR